MNWGHLFTALGEGMLVSLAIFLLTLLFSLPLGMVIAFGRMAKNVVIRTVTKVYISIMRGTPLMLQLFVVFFAPGLLFNIPFSNRFVATIIAFSLNYAAYFAEIYRGGIESISDGQYEAAKVLGYSKGQTFGCIILPQVIKRILPSVTNEIITLVKDTSLAFAIGTIELFTQAKMLGAAESSMIPYIVAGVFYYIFNMVVAVGMERIEKKLNYYR